MGKPLLLTSLLWLSRKVVSLNEVHALIRDVASHANIDAYEDTLSSL